MQNQGTNSKDAFKVPIRQVKREQGKKIKDAINEAIQVLEESRCIRVIF